MNDTATSTLAAARTAFRQHRWDQAYAHFTTARTQVELAPDDLAALANAAWWLGHTDECLSLSEEVYRRYLHGARIPSAATLALTIGALCQLRGEHTVGSGWISRARRLLQDEPESPAHALLANLEVEQANTTGDYRRAWECARQVLAIGERFGDPDTTTLGLVGQGLALIRLGDVTSGTAILDEAMLTVLAGELTPDWTGNIYCQVMQVCHDLADLQRAQEWTAAAERWCAGFPTAVMFTGICRVHRVQLRQVRGDWPGAEQEAVRVCRDLAGMNVHAVAEAHYQLGDIRRMRDDLPGAEAAYTHAHELGRDPQPGLALLRLAQGRADTAAASIDAALCAEPDDRLTRSRLRAAQVEIALVVGDPDSAQAAADELEDIAARYHSPGLEATAAQARGSALLAQERPAEALPALREATRRWRALDAPYLAARVRLLAAQAYRALGDDDATALELDAAAGVFDALGASAASRQVAALRDGSSLPAGLTGREAEVLSLVAAGHSNRHIAESLVISDKTVARHLSNIYGKIGASSRTEAAGFAFTHRLHERRRQPAPE
jgi:ATP/maltotriose-dependent transcriptional regulator MalT